MLPCEYIKGLMKPVIPKQNGDQLPEQQIFLLFFVSSLLISTHLLLPREYIKGLMKRGIEASYIPPALVEYHCYQHLGLGSTSALG